MSKKPTKDELKRKALQSMKTAEQLNQQRLRSRSWTGSPAPVDKANDDEVVSIMGTDGSFSRRSIGWGYTAEELREISFITSQFRSRQVQTRLRPGQVTGYNPNALVRTNLVPRTPKSCEGNPLRRTECAS